MSTLSFKNANNWNEFPELKNHIIWWNASKNDRNIMYTSNSNSVEWKIRINDFPNEPCYTLIINNKETIHFDDWPLFWSRPE